MASAVLQLAPVRRVRRTIEVTVFVFIWMAIGLAFHLDAVPYLLVGIPLTVAFQWGIRRELLAALWLRNNAHFELGKRGWMLACLVAAFPCYSFLMDIRDGATAPDRLMGAAAILGRFRQPTACVIFGVRRFSRSWVVWRWRAGWVFSSLCLEGRISDSHRTRLPTA